MSVKPVRSTTAVPSDRYRIHENRHAQYMYEDPASSSQSRDEEDCEIEMSGMGGVPSTAKRKNGLNNGSERATTSVRPAVDDQYHDVFSDESANTEDVEDEEECSGGEGGELAYPTAVSTKGPRTRKGVSESNNIIQSSERVSLRPHQWGGTNQLYSPAEGADAAVEAEARRQRRRMMKQTSVVGVSPQHSQPQTSSSSPTQHQSRAPLPPRDHYVSGSHGTSDIIAIEGGPAYSAEGHEMLTFAPMHSSSASARPSRRQTMASSANGMAMAAAAAAISGKQKNVHPAVDPDLGSSSRPPPLVPATGGAAFVYASIIPHANSSGGRPTSASASFGRQQVTSSYSGALFPVPSHHIVPLNTVGGMRGAHSHSHSFNNNINGGPSANNVRANSLRQSQSYYQSINPNTANSLPNITTGVGDAGGSGHSATPLSVRPGGMPLPILRAVALRNSLHKAMAERRTAFTERYYGETEGLYEGGKCRALKWFGGYLVFGPDVGQFVGSLTATALAPGLVTGFLIKGTPVALLVVVWVLWGLTAYFLLRTGSTDPGIVQRRSVDVDVPDAVSVTVELPDIKGTYRRSIGSGLHAAHPLLKAPQVEPARARAFSTDPSNLTQRNAHATPTRQASTAGLPPISPATASRTPSSVAGTPHNHNGPGLRPTSPKPPPTETPLPRINQSTNVSFVGARSPAPLSKAMPNAVISPLNSGGEGYEETPRPPKIIHPLKILWPFTALLPSAPKTLSDLSNDSRTNASRGGGLKYAILADLSQPGALPQPLSAGALASRRARDDDSVSVHNACADVSTCLSGAGATSRADDQLLSMSECVGGATVLSSGESAATSGAHALQGHQPHSHGHNHSTSAAAAQIPPLYSARDGSTYSDTVPYIDREVRLRYCFVCCVYRGPRTHHCRRCENCVDIFDHHCPWTGTCIGARNYQSFLCFLLFLNGLVVSVLVSAVVAPLVVSTEEDISITDALLRLWYMPLVIFALAAVVGNSILSLFFYHCFIVSLGVTTLEHIRQTFLTPTEEAVEDNAVHAKGAEAEEGEEMTGTTNPAGAGSYRDNSTTRARDRSKVVKKKKNIWSRHSVSANCWSRWSGQVEERTFSENYKYALALEVFRLAHPSAANDPDNAPWARDHRLFRRGGGAIGRRGILSYNSNSVGMRGMYNGRATLEAGTGGNVSLEFILNLAGSGSGSKALSSFIKTDAWAAMETLSEDAHRADDHVPPTDGCDDDDEGSILESASSSVYAASDLYSNAIGESVFVGGQGTLAGGTGSGHLRHLYGPGHHRTSLSRDASGMVATGPSGPGGYPEMSGATVVETAGGSPAPQRLVQLQVANSSMIPRPRRSIATSGRGGGVGEEEDSYRSVGASSFTPPPAAHLIDVDDIIYNNEAVLADQHQKAMITTKEDSAKQQGVANLNVMHGEEEEEGGNFSPQRDTVGFSQGQVPPHRRHRHMSNSNASSSGVGLGVGSSVRLQSQGTNDGRAVVDPPLLTDSVHVVSGIVGADQSRRQSVSVSISNPAFTPTMQRRRPISRAGTTKGSMREGSGEVVADTASIPMARRSGSVARSSSMIGIGFRIPTLSNVMRGDEDVMTDNDNPDHEASDAEFEREREQEAKGVARLELVFDGEGDGPPTTVNGIRGVEREEEGVNAFIAGGGPLQGGGALTDTGNNGNTHTNNNINLRSINVNTDRVHVHGVGEEDEEAFALESVNVSDQNIGGAYSDEVQRLAFGHDSSHSPTRTATSEVVHNIDDAFGNSDPKRDANNRTLNHTPQNNVSQSFVTTTTTMRFDSLPSHPTRALSSGLLKTSQQTGGGGGGIRGGNSRDDQKVAMIPSDGGLLVGVRSPSPSYYSATEKHAIPLPTTARYSSPLTSRPPNPGVSQQEQRSTRRGVMHVPSESNTSALNAYPYTSDSDREGFATYASGGEITAHKNSSLVNGGGGGKMTMAAAAGGGDARRGGKPDIASRERRVSSDGNNIKTNSKPTLGGLVDLNTSTCSDVSANNSPRDARMGMEMVTNRGSGRENNNNNNNKQRTRKGSKLDGKRTTLLFHSSERGDEEGYSSLSGGEEANCRTPQQSAGGGLPFQTQQAEVPTPNRDDLATHSKMTFSASGRLGRDVRKSRDATNTRAPAIKLQGTLSAPQPSLERPADSRTSPEAGYRSARSEHSSDDAGNDEDKLKSIYGQREAGEHNEAPPVSSNLLFRRGDPSCWSRKLSSETARSADDASRPTTRTGNQRQSSPKEAPSTIIGGFALTPRAQPQ